MEKTFCQFASPNFGGVLHIWLVFAFWPITVFQYKKVVFFSFFNGMPFCQKHQLLSWPGFVVAAFVNDINKLISPWQIFHFLDSIVVIICQLEKLFC